jgi:hypothetical protein
MVTEDEWSGEVAKSTRTRMLSAVVGLVVAGLIYVPCMMLGATLASGVAAD